MNAKEREYALSNLSAIVQCRWPHNAYWETIAAYDSAAIAEDYVAKCKASNGPFLAYRVVLL